jgi:hypothetical protein
MQVYLNGTMKSCGGEVQRTAAWPEPPCRILLWPSSPTPNKQCNSMLHYGELITNVCNFRLGASFVWTAHHDLWYLMHIQNCDHGWTLVLAVFNHLIINTESLGYLLQKISSC